MSRQEEEIAEIQAALARLESDLTGPPPVETEAALVRLRSRLAQLQGPVAPPASAESERKLVTILFADLSGYTAMAEAMDPEEARDLVDAHFQRMAPVIEKYRGTLEKFIGDEIMAVFGAPVASENDAECALRAALEMLDELGRFNAERALDLGMHFGINTGLVIAGHLGARGGEQYAVTGDAVNVAARLRAAAERDQIFVGQDTHRLTAALFEFEALTPLSVKGKSRPIEVYRLLRAKRTMPPTARGGGFRSPLVGRDKEFEELRRALDDLRQGRGAGLALLGEAGLGKSRLVAEVRQRLADGASWVEARAVSFGERLGYGVARDLIEGLGGVHEAASSGERAGRLRTEVQTLFGSRTEEVFPYLVRLCDLPLEGAMLDRVKYLAPEALHGQLLRSVQEYVRARALAGRLVLVVEDLHWIDPSSLGVLETLLPITQQAPLLMLLVARSFADGHARGFAERTFAAPGSPYQVIELSPLPPARGVEMVKHLLRTHRRGESEETPLPTVLDRAEGNPLFIEELLRGLLDAGWLSGGPARAGAPARPGDVEVPHTLHGLLAARIDRLEQPDKRALQSASVIGRIFQRSVLHRVLPGDTTLSPLDLSLLELERRELIRQRAAERLAVNRDDREFIFKHGMIQEITYQTLPLARRRVLHRLCAEALQAIFPERVEEMAATLAHHYEKANATESAIRFLTKAGDRAWASYANEEAIDFYAAAIGQADRLRPTQPERWAELVLQLHESIGDTFLRAARYEEARASYHDAITLLRENHRVQRARLLRKQGNCWFHQRRFEESLAGYDSAQAALGAPADKDDAAWWKEWLAIRLDQIGPYYYLDRLTDLAALIQEIQPTVERFGTPSQRRDALDGLSLIELRRSRFYMPPESVVVRGRQLLADSEESGDLSDAAHYRFMLGVTHLFRDELDAARKELETSVDAAARIGDVSMRTKCLTYLTLVHRKANRLEEAERYASQTLSLANEAQNSIYAGLALSCLFWVAWRGGDLAQAETQARAALAMCPPLFPPRPYALWPLFGVCLARRQIEPAAACAKEILDPRHYRMPADLEETLETALAAFDRSDLDQTLAGFRRASELAARIGYL